jgi:hypothetical protein
MAEDGVVGIYAGSQAREILLTMEQWEAKKAARNSPVSPSPRRLKVQPHDDGNGESAGKPSRAAKPAKRKPARGVDMTAHAASMKPVPGAAAARAAASAAGAAAAATLPAPRFFITRDRLLETAARAGVEPKAAEQLWGLLVAGDGGGGFGVAPQPPRVQIEGADAENKDEDI